MQFNQVRFIGELLQRHQNSCHYARLLRTAVAIYSTRAWTCEPSLRYYLFIIMKMSEGWSMINLKSSYWNRLSHSQFRIKWKENEQGNKFKWKETYNAFFILSFPSVSYLGSCACKWSGEAQSPHQWKLHRKHCSWKRLLSSPASNSVTLWHHAMSPCRDIYTI